MVKIVVVSSYTKNAPTQVLNRSNRMIEGGPLYTNLLAKLDSCEVTIVTQKCIQDTRCCCLETWDVRDLIKLALQQNTFINSQWCSTSKEHVIAACDSYVVSKTIVHADKEQTETKNYYIKFFVASTGNTVATVSLHPPREGDGDYNYEM
ncbi:MULTISPECIES: hypothetical protein [Klebsiella pneumoniae complex]|uniref:hypothetical protein n=1 Tax=Klebsiella pneumoniae complex TaxID=3390273 RepID=UPI0006722DF2|nr:MULTISPECIES: hypothetical protein [Klebsiella]HBZ7661141.1 hypothetical protein [Klebsiella variicola subsp. variicola]MBN7737763.1 hypothetical protein [Klebsiella variicola]MBZ7035335.1 hypothetical protein [Klebsiella variicola]MCF6970150.1 hypothetical protein [Klebsiella variicola]MCJ6258325.1 hypothetical protein [Klebsiella pneumoniae]